MFTHMTRLSLPDSIPLPEKQIIGHALGMRRIPAYMMSLLYLLKENFRELAEMENFGILYVSHFGAADQNARYLYNLLDYPADQATPSVFSNSVFNAPAAYISRFFHSHGPTLSIHGFRKEISSSIRTAEAWLQTGFCSDILIVFADEDCDATQILKTHCRTRLFIPAQIMTVSKHHFTGAAAEENAASELVNQLERSFQK